MLGQEELVDFTEEDFKLWYERRYQQEAMPEADLTEYLLYETSEGTAASELAYRVILTLIKSQVGFQNAVNQVYLIMSRDAQFSLATQNLIKSAVVSLKLAYERIPKQVLDNGTYETLVADGNGGYVVGSRERKYASQEDWDRAFYQALKETLISGKEALGVAGEGVMITRSHNLLIRALDELLK